VRTVGPTVSDDEADTLLELAQTRGLCIAALVVKPAAWHQFGLRPDQHALLARLQDRVPTVMCSLGSPDILDGLATGPYRMCTYSDVTPSVEAAARRIAGRLQLT